MCLSILVLGILASDRTEPAVLGTPLGRRIRADHSFCRLARIAPDVLHRELEASTTARARNRISLEPCAYSVQRRVHADYTRNNGQPASWDKCNTVGDWVGASWLEGYRITHG